MMITPDASSCSINLKGLLVFDVRITVLQQLCYVCATVVKTFRVITSCSAYNRS